MKNLYICIPLLLLVLFLVFNINTIKEGGPKPPPPYCYFQSDDECRNEAKFGTNLTHFKCGRAYYGPRPPNRPQSYVGKCA